MYLIHSLAYIESNPSEEYKILELDDGSTIVLPIIVLKTDNTSKLRKLLHESVDKMCDAISVDKFLGEN